MIIKLNGKAIQPKIDNTMFKWMDEGWSPRRPMQWDYTYIHTATASATVEWTTETWTTTEWIETTT